MKKALLLLSLLLLVIIAPVHALARKQFSSVLTPPPVLPLRVLVLDIGQGDSTLIVSPTGKIIVVDAGNPGNDATILAAIRRFTGPQCRIDLFVASHPHADHIGSAAAVIRACRVASVVDSNFTSSTSTYERYLQAVHDSGARYIPAEPGQNFDMGGSAKLTVLAPIKPFFKQSELRSGANEPNANSVVMRLDYGDFSMLFTGDGEAETEARMMEKGTSLRARVLKVGHHGSRYASSEEFLQAVQPEAATISVGSDNNYGHPSPPALERLRAARVNLYRTDLQGIISITSNGRRYQIRPQRAASARALWRGRTTH